MGAHESLRREWRHRRFSGSAGEFHEMPLPDPPIGREVWWSVIDRPALVLGSSMSVDAVRRDELFCALPDAEVVTRRSGGGAVLLVPGEFVWVDLLIGRDDPLWHDDVGRAMWWVGDLWAAALGDLGVTFAVWKGPMRHSPLSPFVCFAGLGPGEVTDVADRKLVGISQRRTRHGARFQCAVYGRWRPEIVDFLRVLDGESADRPPRSPAVATIPMSMFSASPSSGSDLEGALVRALDRLS